MTPLISRLARIADRVTKIMALGSAAAAIYLLASLGGRGWSPLLPLTIWAFAALAVAARFRPSIAWQLVLGCLYLSPLFFNVMLGRELAVYGSVWMGACLGAVVGSGQWRGWLFPGKWRWPLTYWTLAVAGVWPVIVFRESDFYWPLMNVDRIGNSANGGPPAVVSVWILCVALTHLLGLLTFEAFTSAAVFRSPQKFLRNALAPLGIAAAAGCALAVYQGTIDVTFLSGHQWAAENRAAGSLLDGDAFGGLAAMWVPVFFAIAWAGRGVALRSCGAIAGVLAIGGAWATGSRIALAGLVVGAVVMLIAVVRYGPRLSRLPATRAVGAAAVLAVVLLAGLLAAVRFSSSESPVRRLRESLPAMNRVEISRFAVHELWNRGGPYGDMSVAMITAFPPTGVGVGSFNHLFPDFAYERSLRLSVNEGIYPFDNAQSWYRHHLAELGVLGSLGWIAWCVSFGWLALRTNGRNEQPLGAVIAAPGPGLLVKGGLCVVAMMSLVSMPSQNFAVSMTVWVFAAWYLYLSPRAHAAARLAGPADEPRLAPIVIPLVVAAAFWSTTAFEGYAKLRPPYRAVMAQWPYRYGLDQIEASETDSPYSWMVWPRAVEVVPMRRDIPGWVKLTLSSGGPDIATRPLHVRVYRGRQLIADVPAFDGQPLTWYLRSRPEENGVMYEVQIDRMWVAEGADTRQLGIRVDKPVLVTDPPRGAVRVY